MQRTMPESSYSLLSRSAVIYDAMLCYPLMVLIATHQEIRIRLLREEAELQAALLPVVEPVVSPPKKTKLA